MISRRSVLAAFAAAPVLGLARPAPGAAAVPAGWSEAGIEDRKTVLANKTVIARGDDRDLAAALGPVPAHVTRVAVRIA